MSENETPRKHRLSIDDVEIEPLPDEPLEEVAGGASPSQLATACNEC